MMKFCALLYFTISIVNAGFFTPGSEQKQHIYSKEDHAPGAVIELEQSEINGNTKVSVSPKEHAAAAAKGKLEEAKDKIKEAATPIPLWVKESARDAAGGVSRKAKEQVNEGVKTAKKVKDEAASGVSSKVKEQVHEGVEAAQKVKEEAANGVSSKAKEGVEAAQKVKEEAANGVSSKAKEGVEAAKKIKEEAANGVSSKAKKGVEAAKKIKEAERKGEELVERARERRKGLFEQVVKNVVSPMSGLLLHLLGFAVAYGMCVWVTFACSCIMEGALPRLQFAMLQSKMYPVYFKAMVGSVGVALLGYLMMSSQIRRASSIFNLMASLAMILVNMIYLEPRTTKMAFERMKKEKEEHATEPEQAEELHTTDTSAGKRATTVQGETKEATTRSLLVRMGLNASNTSLLNVATLVSLTCHLLQLGQQLHAAC